MCLPIQSLKKNNIIIYIPVKEFMIDLSVTLKV